MSSSKASSATKPLAVKVEDPNPNPAPGFLAPAPDAGADPAAGPSSEPFRPAAASASPSVDSDLEDEYLRGAEALTREEVLRRRSRHVKQLARYYRRQYWALMEELRIKHRDYYWEFGVSPFEDENGGSRMAPADNGGVDSTDAPVLGGGEENGGPVGFVFEGDGTRKREVRKKCVYPGCKSKAMPLTSYCHPHILSDKRQKLYKPCTSTMKSCGQSGPFLCAKPVTRGLDPCLCPTHFERYQRTIAQAMKRSGVNVPSSGKPPFKINFLLAEYVIQIQAKRREELEDNTEASQMNDEKAS